MSHITRFAAFVKKLGRHSRILAPIAAGLLVAGVATAWVGPPGSPPNCPSGSPGCATPLDTSSTAQTKTGQLTINSSSYYGLQSIISVGGYGVYGSATASGGEGVYGTGGTYGVHGFTSSGDGVIGISTSGIGMRGSNSSGSWGGYFTGTYGVYGQGGSYGVEGDATSGGYGVYGIQGGNGYGVYGYAVANGGVGVRGDGNAYGVEGVNTATGYYGIIGYENYTIYGNGYLYGSGGYTGSDERLKQNIQDLPTDEGLAAILQLRPVTFDWKDAAQNATMGQQLGFIAQEVKPLIPQAVITTPDQTITLQDGTKQTITAPMAIDYSKLVAPLVKAVQEQQQEIDDLKAQVATLEAKQ